MIPPVDYLNTSLVNSVPWLTSDPPSVYLVLKGPFLIRTLLAIIYRKTNSQFVNRVLYIWYSIVLFASASALPRLFFDITLKIYLHLNFHRTQLAYTLLRAIHFFLYKNQTIFVEARCSYSKMVKISTFAHTLPLFYAFKILFRMSTFIYNNLQQFNDS